ncbi:Hint domain-containing protein [Tropicimonas marinistellae]|uniref:Hint domain-containing protein n=1 Tax=Tropicimonas marinistellae TaxID=1739787 RepID=UPI00082C099F|nr:Hint domain-containing protein [Tropicimonas marinistellae]
MLDWLSGRTGKKPATGKSGIHRQTEFSGGLAAGTLVATPNGWLPVESICVGDDVVTFDDGIQTVTGVSRRLHPLRPADITRTAPVLSIPAGLIGNRRPMTVSEGQAVVVESDLAETVLGDAFALVEARQLSRLGGTRKVRPEEPVIIVTLSFEEEQMVFVEGNALVLCPAEDALNPVTIEAAMWGRDHGRYTVLPRATAEMVVASMGLQNAYSVRASISAPDPRYA